MTAEGKSLRMLGKIVAIIHLGSRKYLSPKLVADITVDEIIGFQHNFAFLIPNKVFSVDGKQHMFAWRYVRV